MSIGDAWEMDLPDYLEWFDPIGPEEVDRIFGAVKATTHLLDPYPSCLVKTSRMVTCKWVQAGLTYQCKGKCFQHH